MAIPDSSTFLSDTKILNRVLLFLGLPKIPQNRLTHLMLNSDEELAYTLLTENSRITQGEGWWFNTVYDYVVEADSTSALHAVEHPQFGAQLEVLNVINKQRNKCMDEDYTMWVPLKSLNLITTADGKNAEHDGFIDYVFVKELQYCPDTFIDFIIKKTAAEMAAALGQQFNLDAVDMAEMAFKKEHSKNAPKRNVFRR